jgi:hypothetical protein
MRALLVLPLLLTAVFAGSFDAAHGQEAMGWQDQRTTSLQSPGRSMPMLRLLSRNHDMGRHETGSEVRLGRDVTIRQGRAYLFTARSDDFPIARLSGAVDSKGLRLIVSWPP